MPQETRSPSDPSALRIGTPWVTTRGMKEDEMVKIAAWINKVMEICGKWRDLSFKEFEEAVHKSDEIKIISEEVKELCGRFLLSF